MWQKYNKMWMTKYKNIGKSTNKFIIDIFIIIIFFISFRKY